MAIYHATMKSFSRGNGDSSVAAAAYRAGFDLLDTKDRAWPQLFPPRRCRFPSDACAERKTRVVL